MRVNNIFLFIYADIKGIRVCQQANLHLEWGALEFLLFALKPAGLKHWGKYETQYVSAICEIKIISSSLKIFSKFSPILKYSIYMLVFLVAWTPTCLLSHSTNHYCAMMFTNFVMLEGCKMKLKLRVIFQKYKNFSEGSRCNLRKHRAKIKRNQFKLEWHHQEL